MFRPKIFSESTRTCQVESCTTRTTWSKSCNAWHNPDIQSLHQKPSRFPCCYICAHGYRVTFVTVIRQTVLMSSSSEINKLHISNLRSVPFKKQCISVWIVFSCIFWDHSGCEALGNARQIDTYTICWTLWSRGRNCWTFPQRACWQATPGIMIIYSSLKIVFIFRHCLSWMRFSSVCEKLRCSLSVWVYTLFLKEVILKAWKV